MKMAALLGALRGLEQRRVFCRGDVSVVAGSSSGAILAALVAKGYTVAEIKQLLLYDTKVVGDIVEDDPSRLNALTVVWRLMKRHGLDDGSRFVKWLDRVFGKDTTFADIKAVAGVSLLVTATSYTDHSLITFSDVRTPHARVVAALRASCSLPFLFRPVESTNGQVLIDGGVLCNFPLRHCMQQFPNQALYVGVDFDYCDAAISFRWNKEKQPSAFEYVCNIASLLYYRIAHLERRLMKASSDIKCNVTDVFVFRVPVQASYMNPPLNAKREQLEQLFEEGRSCVHDDQYMSFIAATAPETVYELDVAAMTHDAEHVGVDDFSHTPLNESPAVPNVTFL